MTETDKKKLHSALRNMQKAHDQIIDIGYEAQRSENFKLAIRELNESMRDLSHLMGEG